MADDTNVTMIPTGQVAFDWQAYASAPKYFSQYAIANVTHEEATLAFCFKVPGLVEDHESEIGMTQAVVFMGVPHFRRFAAMISEQAARLDELVAKGFEETLQNRQEETEDA